jgi:recombinational DNA repair protein RecR
MEALNNIKICKVCQKSDNKFFQNKKICSICSSRLSNERNKQKHYFKEYYQLNKENILSKYHEQADLKPKLKQGRPKKIV